MSQNNSAPTTFNINRVQGIPGPAGPTGPSGLGSVVLSGTPSTGQVPTATGTATATWQTPSSSGFTAGGDLTGSSSSQQVVSATGSAGIFSLATTAASIIWATATSAPTLKHADNTTNSATGQALTVQAQNATGTTSVGGNLVLQSGTGTSTPGTILFKVGATTVAQASQSSTDFDLFGATPATTGFIRVANNATIIAARNAANSANIPLLATDASNNINVGDAASAQGALTVIYGKTGVSASVNAVTTLQLANATTDFIKLGAPTATGGAYGSAGYLRFGDIQASALTLITSRNSTNTADISMMYTDGAGDLYLNNNGSTLQLSGTGAALNTSVGSLIISSTGNAIISYVIPSFKTQSVSGAFAFDSDANLTIWNHNINGTTIMSVTPTKVSTKKGLNRHVNVQASPYTVLVSDDIVIFSANAKTATLPASPTAGDKYTIGLNAAAVTNTFIVSGNGINIIYGGASAASVTFTTSAAGADQVVTFIYDGTVWVAAGGY